MPQFFIKAVNYEFASRDDGADYDTPDLAMAAGVRSALQIASDEVIEGRPSAAVEINIEREDGATVRRSVLSLSVSPLLVPVG